MSIQSTLYHILISYAIFILLFQLVRLLENLELYMINEVRKRVAKELTLALAERAREENALPTDLWKRAVSIMYYRHITLANE